jgi:hypothetical protein
MLIYSSIKGTSLSSDTFVLLGRIELILISLIEMCAVHSNYIGAISGLEGIEPS